MELMVGKVSHRGREWIGIRTENRASVNETLKKIGARWSVTHKRWLLPYEKAFYAKLVEHFGTAIRIVRGPELDVSSKFFAGSAEAELLPANAEALRKFLETLRLKAYSENTIRTYRGELLQLLITLKRRAVNSLTDDEVRRYLHYCITSLGLKEATLHSRINALKFYFEQVLRRDKFFYNIPRPKKPLQLPRFFNKAEIVLIIKSVGNLKHQAMLMLAYGTGMRVSEVVNLKTRNVDSSRMSILVEAAKGKKDRVVRLSPVLLLLLREYWKKFQPSRSGYLFEGQERGTAYSARSLQLVLQKAKERAGILKPGGIHALRHSFATHLLDKGTDITMIMKLLGHNDLKTTLRYIHVTNRDLLNVISPLDDLSLGTSDFA
jgi:integrase/recombinase XerD